MDESQQITVLKKLLREEVSSFCSQDGRGWKKAIIDTIHEIRRREWSAVFFGGTLRSLLLSRLNKSGPGRPRDIDIVVNSVDIDDLHASFERFVSRETRFGGLQLKRVNWQFDVWPLQETFRLKEMGVTSPTFSDLPSTTFFNIEAIAVDVWPKRGCSRQIYSCDDQFFRGVIHRTIEINCELNPFPELCVVRALVMAANLQWKVGPCLLAYLGKYGRNMSSWEFEDIQKKHYGVVQWDGALFQAAMTEIQIALQHNCMSSVRLMLPRQMTLWPEDDNYTQQITLATLSIDKQ